MSVGRCDFSHHAVARNSNTACIAPRKSRKVQFKDRTSLHKSRDIVERRFGHLEDWRCARSDLQSPPRRSTHRCCFLMRLRTKGCPCVRISPRARPDKPPLIVSPRSSPVGPFLPGWCGAGYFRFPRHHVSRCLDRRICSNRRGPACSRSRSGKTGHFQGFQRLKTALGPLPGQLFPDDMPRERIFPCDTPPYR